MKIDIITLFPEMLSGFLNSSMLKLAQEAGYLMLSTVNPRDFTHDKHRTCDDRPFGGGSGMILKPEPIYDAVESVRSPEAHVLLMCPQGGKFTQDKAIELAQFPHLIIISGHYEGVDERIRKLLVHEEISIGDYILTNGTLSSAVLVDAVVRLVPGVLGNPESTAQESFTNNLLEYPQYTRPRVFKGLEVPSVLLEGHHEKIEAWRRDRSLEKTRKIRPDLLDRGKSSIG